jgi:hypothetical protein
LNSSLLTNSSLSSLIKELIAYIKEHQAEIKPA